jgi:hypothetical protein
VDLWVNFTAMPTTTHLLGLHTSGSFTEWCLLYQSGAIQFFTSGAVVISRAWVPTLGTWYHLATTRQAGTLRLFIDGDLKASVANTANIGGSRVLAIGAADNPALFFNGYFDEIRISKGTAWWTNNFTPPTAPYN